MNAGLKTMDEKPWGESWRLTVLGFAAAVISGVMLAMAFPPWDIAALAWLAWVPLLTTVAYVAPRRAFFMGGIAGMVYWLMVTVWLLRLAPHASLPVAGMGWMLLAVYSAGYTACFSWIYCAVWRGLPWGAVGRNLTLLITGPLVWAGLEYIRCRFLTGYPWNPLGVSQYRNLPVIQIAEWTGVHGVSALVMLLNISLSLTLLRYVDPAERRRGVHLEFAAAALLIAVCWRVGMERVRRFDPHPAARALNIAVVQTGVPQYEKWEDGLANVMLDNLREGLHEAALKASIDGGRPPDVMVLPETVFPYYSDHPSTRAFMAETLDALPVPILAGVMARETHHQKDRYFNRSILYLPGVDPPPFYDKQHLVPFGETIPFSRWIPWLERFAPLGWNCTPGTEATVLRIPGDPTPFSVTICFEDAFPYISRRFARAGARLLINQTNDAWFDPSSASRQHLAQGIFRSVETRLPTVRAANTGISAVIDRNGRIRDALPPTDTREPRRAVAAWQVAPAPEGETTWFVRYGDWTFNLPAVAVALIMGGMAFRGMILKRKEGN